MHLAIDYKKSGARLNQEHPIKRTALIYLKEALLKERYEECKDMIDIAREFGAADKDITDILAAYSLKLTPLRKNSPTKNLPIKIFMRRRR